MKEEMPLKDLLRKIRCSNHYTQEFVAKHLNITRQAYGHYENGITTPDVKMLVRLADFFQVPVTLFIEASADHSSKLREEQHSYMPKQGFTMDFSEFLSFYSIPENIKKYHYLSRSEKEMLFYFQKLSDQDKKDLILFAYMKANKQEYL